jgi:ATP-dependent DNA helicase RecQ
MKEHSGEKSVMTALHPELEVVLHERFGLKSFRPWQREAIEAVLPQGSRVLVVAPTGGGKSLTYQFPATILPGVCVVISPLVALMEDQVRGLQARGIAATYLASTLSAEVRQAREAGLRQGHFKLVYVSPERLAFDSAIEQLARLRPSLVAIDEAHCISQWGHDFRPDYARLGEVLEKLRPPRILACTATATPQVRRDIRDSLRYPPERAVEILRGFARPNLHLSARSVDGPTEAMKLLQDELRARLGSVARPNGAAIVYAATRKESEKIAGKLAALGYNSAAYHAGLDPSVRTQVSRRFALRDVDVVVATNAFGMGIDRPDIRAVVHAQPPASIEAYYQEVGRAGRDGAEAHGLLLCSGVDIALRRRLVESASDGTRADEATIQRNWRLFRDLLRYLDAGTCRHDFVLRYFGDEREVLGGCGHCDVCASLDEPTDSERAEVGEVVRMALSAVARAKNRAGMIAIAEMLRGVDNAKTQRFGFTRLSTFGLMKDRSQDWVLALLRGLLAAGWIDLSTGEYPMPFVTKGGWAMMTSKDLVRFRLPRVRAKRSSGRTKSEGTQDTAQWSLSDKALFERLRGWRAKVAKDRGDPPYVIALDKTLHEIVRKKPSSLAALPGIFGLGPARIELYGSTIVELVRAS